MIRAFLVVLALMLSACARSGPCGDVDHAVDVRGIAPGIGAELVTLGAASIGPFGADVRVLIDVSADRRLESENGIRGPSGATAAYHFVRLRLDGKQWQNVADTTDTMLPIAPESCVAVRHKAAQELILPAGGILSAESVWSVVRPFDGGDVLAITDSLSLSITKLGAADE